MFEFVPRNIKNRQKNYTFLTFDNRVIKLGDMEHNHLSNCVWYAICFGYVIHLTIYLAELDRRFNGKILSYMPKKEFKTELEGLKSNHLIEENGMIKMPKRVYINKRFINGYERIIQTEEDTFIGKLEENIFERPYTDFKIFNKILELDDF